MKILWMNTVCDQRQSKDSKSMKDRVGVKTEYSKTDISRCGLKYSFRSVRKSKSTGISE